MTDTPEDGVERLDCPHCRWTSESTGVSGALELGEHLLDDHRDVLPERVASVPLTLYSIDAQQAEDGVERTRLPKYGEPRVERYTREGWEEDQERVKVVREKTVRTGTLTGDGTAEHTIEQTLADFPEAHDYNVLRALADEFNVRLEER